ncbi:MAG: ABC transporter permease [bacterium]|nr:ABC transporter permease [bacterium]
MSGAVMEGANPGQSKRVLIEKLANQPEFAVSVIVLLLLGLLVFGTPYFLTANNLASLQTSIGPRVLVALGMTVLFVTGTFDLSVGATMGLAGLVVAAVLSAGQPAEVAILAGLGTGFAIGLTNGILVSYIGLNPLIVTLGALFILRGIANLMIGGGRTLPWMYVSNDNVDGGFHAIGSLHLGPFHIVFVSAIVLALVFDIGFRRHALGRSLFFAGDNPDAAKSLGMPVQRIQLSAFVLCGVLSATAGMFIVARTGLASRHVGTGVELEIIIACLIGGSSIAGGKGSILGSVLGVVFVTLVNNAFNLFEVASQWQKVVVGAVLIAVIASDRWRTTRRRTVSSDNAQRPLAHLRCGVGGSESG